MPEPAADTREVADQVAVRVEHAERLTAIRELKPREREALFLKGAGYSYQEIAKLTGSSYTNVIWSRLRQCRLAAPLARRRHVADGEVARAPERIASAWPPTIRPRALCASAE
jgi:DNA-directed RNA polymerase specialized sigma24 family protein